MDGLAHWMQARGELACANQWTPCLTSRDQQWICLQRRRCTHGRQLSAVISAFVLPEYFSIHHLRMLFKLFLLPSLSSVYVHGPSARSLQHTASVKIFVCLLTKCFCDLFFCCTRQWLACWTCRCFGEALSTRRTRALLHLVYCAFGLHITYAFVVLWYIFSFRLFWQ